MKRDRIQRSSNQSWFPNFSQWFVRALSLSSLVTLSFPQRTQAATPGSAHVVQFDFLLPSQKVVFTGKAYTKAEMDVIKAHPVGSVFQFGFLPYEVGDINHDGRGDFTFSESVAEITNNTLTGIIRTTYLVFGADDFNAKVDLTQLSLTQGVRFTKRDKLLGRVASSNLLPIPTVGDLSGDGIDDIMFNGGAIVNPNTGISDGTSIVLYWTEGGTFANDVMNVDESPLMHRIEIIDSVGDPVGVGDIDGNKRSDILTAASDGAKLIYMGVAPDRIFLGNATLPQVQSFPVNSPQAGKVSIAIRAIGDTTLSGTPDFLIGNTASQPIGNTSVQPSFNLIYGRAFDRPLPLFNVTMADGVVIYGGTASASLPTGTVGSGKAGDVNKDRRADYLFVSPPYTTVNKIGKVRIILGSNSTSNVYLDELSADQGITIVGESNPSVNIYNLFYAGAASDVNGDGYDDIYIYSTLNDGTAKIFILFGGKLDNVVSLSALTAEQGIILTRAGNKTAAPLSFTIPSFVRAVESNGNSATLFVIPEYDYISESNSHNAILIKGSVITDLANSTQPQQVTSGPQTSSVTGQTGATTLPPTVTTPGTGITGATTVVTGSTKTDVTGGTTTNVNMSEATATTSNPTTAAVTTTKATVNAASHSVSGIDFIFTFLIFNTAARLFSDSSFLLNLMAGLSIAVSATSVAKDDKRHTHEQTSIDHNTVLAATQRGVFRSANSSTSHEMKDVNATSVANKFDMSRMLS